MFSLGRLPRIPRDRDSALEFIPIGQSLSSKEPQRNAPSIKSKVSLTADKINNTHVDSSFDEATREFDSIDVEDVGNAPSGSRVESAGWGSRGVLANTLEQRSQAIDGGQSSIHGLQADSQQLKAENYNLKVEVATLKQFLKQTPPETMELVSQNSTLKQELIKTQDELEELKRRSNEGSQSSSQQSSSHEVEMNALKRSYRESLDEKNQELHRLQRQVDDLSRESPPQVPPELLKKVEFLQSENQSLVRQLDGASAVSNKNQSQLQTENNGLKMDLHRLRAQLAELPSDAGEKLNKLKDTNNKLEREVGTLSKELQQAEDEIDSMRLSSRKLEATIQEKQAQIDSLTRTRDESATSKSRSLRESESKTEQHKHELHDLKSKLRRADAAYTSLAEDKSAETHRLQKKIDLLQKKLEDKDHDELDLRAQMKALMEERNRAFDNKSTIQHYQSQIDSLRERENTLATENLKLKDEVARLQDELYSHNIDSSRVGKLKQENSELIDRVDYYEKEYGLLQEAMDAVESELDTMKANKARDEELRHSLERELESMRTQLRRTELSESRKYNESAYMELEEKHRKREEAEHRRMTSQIDKLNNQIRVLEQELQESRRPQHVSPKATAYNPAQDEMLQIATQRKNYELQEKSREIAKLEKVLRDKEDLIDALEERIRKLDKDMRTDFTYEDRHRETLQKLKLDHQTEMLAMSLERDKLQSEVRHYKARLEKVMEEDDTQIPSSANSVTIALLETQLEDLRRKNKDMSAEVERMSATRHANSNREIDDLREKVRELRFALNDIQQEKSDWETTKDTMESDLSLLRSEKSRLDSRNKSMSQDLAKNARSCTRLANRVQELESQISTMQRNSEEVFKAQKSNSQLQSQVDQLGAKLATANLSSHPSQSLTVTKMRLQENVLKYYKAKLFELQTRYMDLALINSFINSSIKNSYESCKDDLVKMARSGIYPDYSALGHRNDHKKEKLTFKAVAMFVLGAVRMRKRAERTKVREGKLMRLRGDIERDRLTLLVEN